jgi:hypothetical protein
MKYKSRLLHAAIFTAILAICYFLDEALGLGAGITLGVGAVIAGPRTSANTTSTNKAIDMDPQMKYIQDYQTPINQFYIMDKAASRPTKESRSKFRWHEKSALARTNTLSAGLTGGAATESTVALGTSTLLKFGDTFLVVSTGEVLRVTSTGNTTTVNVANTQSGNITAVGAGAAIIILNSAVKEDYARTETISNNAEEKIGYCQIGLDGVQMSGREDAEEKYTDGESFKDLVNEKLREITKYEERKWLYNAEARDDSSANITYSAGFRRVTTNVKTWAGSLDETEILDMLEMVFAQQDTNELFAYGGGSYMRGLDAFLKDRFTYNTDDYIKVYGGLSKTGGSPKLLKFLSPWGMVNYCWNPMLSGDVYSNSCLYLNRSKTKLRYMKNDSNGSRKFRIEPDVQDNGTGLVFDQLMWDTGLDTGPEIYHGWHHKS